MKPLQGLRILLVEDEYVTAMDLKNMLIALGADVVGPVGGLDQARALAEREHLDGAILDVKLDHHTSLPLAEELEVRGTPIILATGYDVGVLPDRFADTPKLKKPYSDKKVATLTTAIFRRD